MSGKLGEYLKFKLGFRISQNVSIQEVYAKLLQSYYKIIMHSMSVVDRVY